MLFEQELPRRVRARRKALNLTQRNLAELAGCHYMFVSDLEQGKQTLRLDKVLAVLRVLGLDVRVDE